mmetsp:Transcript_38878/g.122514  ORF Transcript_38878/g.122514 Transcript_38878/m.122514 type:complete len:119 (-) Transcript_38878:494-850(-)
MAIALRQTSRNGMILVRDQQVDHMKRPGPERRFPVRARRVTSEQVHGCKILIDDAVNELDCSLSCAEREESTKNDKSLQVGRECMKLGFCLMKSSSGDLAKFLMYWSGQIVVVLFRGT